MRAGWTSRLAALGRHRATELTWPQVWALVAREIRLFSLSSAEARLWQLRYASWILSLDADPRTCRACGDQLADALGTRAAYCSVACRKLAHRCREGEEPTPLEAEVEQAKRSLADLRSKVALGERALRRWQKERVSVEPPDWSAVDHVPDLPSPCSGGCLSPCEHTGGPCLYAHTRRPLTDAPEDAP